MSKIQRSINCPHCGGKADYFNNKEYTDHIAKIFLCGKGHITEIAILASYVSNYFNREED